MLGRLVPSLRNAKAWARNGKRVLEEELSLQFHNDGVGAEQSPTYSAFTLEWLLLGAVIGDRVGDKWSNASWHRMVQAGNHLRALTDCNGHQPLIGDDDESCPANILVHSNKPHLGFSDAEDLPTQTLNLEPNDCIFRFDSEL